MIRFWTVDPEVLTTGSRLTNYTAADTSFFSKRKDNSESRIKSPRSIKSKAVENHSQAEVGLSPNQGTSNTCLEGFLGLLWNSNSSVPPIFSSFWTGVSVPVIWSSSHHCMVGGIKVKRRSCIQDITLGASWVAKTVKNLPEMWENLGREDPWRRAWQLTSVFLPGDFHGQRSLPGYSPWGLQWVWPNWVTWHLLTYSFLA